MSIVLFLFAICLHRSESAVTISAHFKGPTKLMAIDESIVYKALTVIEGDILVDKYCECQSERWCRVEGRNVIVLSQ